jgi:hypothetical protein
MAIIRAMATHKLLFFIMLAKLNVFCYINTETSKILPAKTLNIPNGHKNSMTYFRSLLSRKASEMESKP